MAEETRTIKGWLEEAAYIQRNAAWQGWAGAQKFLAIKHMLKTRCGMSDDGFMAWVDRIQKCNPTPVVADRRSCAVWHRN